MQRDTLTRLPLTIALTHHTRSMAGANAGIKRNRRPPGVKVTKRMVILEDATLQKLKAASMASGSLSLSLYLERLFGQLEAEHGALPVLSPTLDGAEVPKDTAA